MSETYKVRENHTNKYQNKNDENTESKYTINDQLLLEMILVAIRGGGEGETITYSSRRKKESLKQETQLKEDKFQKLEHDISENLENTNSDKITSLNEKRNNYMKLGNIN